MPALRPLITLAVPVPRLVMADPAPIGLARAPDVPEMEYTYVELNYLWTDSDDLRENVDGWELTGLLEVPLNLFGRITVSRQSDDGDLDAYRIGAGYHLPLGSRLDAFGILSLAHVEVDGSGNDFDDTGLAGELGLHRPFPASHAA